MMPHDAPTTRSRPESHEEPDPDHVLSFWFGELDADGLASEETVKRWWTKDPDVDAHIRDRFQDLHREIRAGRRAAWIDDARGRLATIIVLDQLSRNMFRDSADMFAADDDALAMALAGIEAGMDRALPVAQRAFFYLPLMHSEQLAAQDRCVELFEILRDELEGRAREQIAGNLKFAVMHRDIVAKFGRFPHRNAILGRQSTPEELEFLKQPGSSF